MDTVNRDFLRNLAEANGETCVSLYIPTERSGKETLQNPTRLRQVIREARETMDRSGVEARAADKVLAPALARLDDYPFWQHQAEGLALFLRDGDCQIQNIPYSVQAKAVVGPGFHLKPLLPLVAYDNEFLVLALSKNAVRLYRASRYHIEEVPIPGVPQTEAEALRLDEGEEMLRAFPGAPSTGDGGPNLGYHGHGAAREDAKNRTLRFFLRIDRALHPHLRESRAPMILATVDHHVPIYRDANTYGHLLGDIVAGNPEGLSPDDLRTGAWSKVERLLDAAREQTLATVAEGLAKGQAHGDLEQAVAAACHGRVAKCVVAQNQECWGRFDPSTARIHKLHREDPDACDLVDLTATQTFLHGGDVYPVADMDAVPGEGPVAVLLRY